MKLRMVYPLLALCAALCVCASSVGSAEGALRLHVIANSDSDLDQAVKLLVRDEVLELTSGEFSGLNTARAAETLARTELEPIERAAEAVLRRNGFSYGAEAYVTRERFPDREYGSVLYPENEYCAVKIVLGEGAGANWWCLLFPPLCIQDTEGGESYDTEFKSLILEWLNGGLDWETVFVK